MADKKPLTSGGAFPWPPTLVLFLDLTGAIVPNSPYWLALGTLPPAALPDGLHRFSDRSTLPKATDTVQFCAEAM